MSDWRIDKYGDDFWFVQWEGHCRGTVQGRFKSLGFEAILPDEAGSLGRFPSRDEAAEALVIYAKENIRPISKEACS